MCKLISWVFFLALTSQIVDFAEHVICLRAARCVNMHTLFMMESGLVNCSQFVSLLTAALVFEWP